MVASSIGNEKFLQATEGVSYQIRYSGRRSGSLNEPDGAVSARFHRVPMRRQRNGRRCFVRTSSV